MLYPKQCLVLEKGIQRFVCYNPLHHKWQESRCYKQKRAVLKNSFALRACMHRRPAQSIAFTLAASSLTFMKTQEYSDLFDERARCHIHV